MRQRILSTLLVFCLLLGEFSISASAAEIASGTCGESSGVSWILDDSGTLTICGNGAMPDYGWSVAGGGNAPWIDYTDNIKSVVVESGVTKVGGCAFWGCDNLKTVTLSETVTDITGGAFFEMCDSLEEIVVDKNNPLYIAINGVLFTSDLQTLVVYPSGKKEISYTVPEITKVIGDNAFIQSQLETVILPEGLAKIEDSAFYSCSVSNITIPDSVTEIGAGAFAYCYNLTNIEIPEKVTQIDEQTFSFCDNLTTVVLPSTIETIADWAFAYDTKLSDVYYGGSLSDWSKIDIGESNEYLTSATIHCKDGVISTDKIVGFYPGNNAQIEKLEQSMIRIEFDREVLSGQVRNNYADLDFSKTPLAIYRASDDQLLYQVKENNGEGISFDVTSYPSSPTEVNISITNGESLFVPGESYYVTMGAGFIRLTDGTTSPEINKNDWTFKIKSIDKLIGYSFLNRSDPNLLEAGFSSNTKYMITGDYLNALKNNLGPIEETLACIMRQNKWEGHCYGMAAVFALQKTNNIDLAFFQKDVEELFELDFPKNNWTVFNLLTYYHLLQRNDLDRFNYSLQGQADNAENVIEIMKQEEKFVIIEITTLSGRHAVVGLGISKINDIYEIPIWDPNYFETDIMYVDTKNKNYWLESEHYSIAKILAATTVDMLNECNLEQQLKDMGHTSMAQSMSMSTDFQEDGPNPLYLITNYESFTVKAGGRVANIVDGEKISGNLEFPSGIYLNEMYSSNNELLFCIDLSQIDNFTIESNKSGEKPSLTQILYQYDQPTGVAYIVKTDGDCKFNFNIDGTLNAAFSNSQSNYITAIRNTTYNRWNNVILSMADGNITIDNTPDNIQLSSSSNTTINVSLGDSFNSTEMGEVAVTEAGLTIQSGNKKEEIVDNSSGKILSEEMLNHSIFFNSLGGTLLDPVTNIPYNTVVLPPENPERENYEFDGWYLSPGFEAGTEWDFSNPITHDLELYAKWISIEDSEGDNDSNSSIGSNGESYYRVSIADTSNGIVTVTPKSATRGNRIAITITPDSGYKLENLRVVDNRGKQIQLNSENDQYIFIMPAADVTVEATFMPAEENNSMDSFQDVDSTAWYYNAVKYVVENGIMSGTGSNQFSPNMSLSRAMIAQILYNLEKRPGSGKTSFTDVIDGQWYTEAVTWAADNKIVSGYGNDAFGPNDAVTREQLAVILYHYAQYKGYTTMINQNLSGFADGDSASVWAVEALEWAVSQGVVAGKSGNMLDPIGTATRAEVAQMFFNYLTSL